MVLPRFLPLLIALLFVAPRDAEPALEFESIGQHEEPVRQLFFLDKGKLLGTATRGGAVRLWIVRSGKSAGEYDHERELDQVLVSNDGRGMAFISGPTLGRLDGKDAQFEGSVAYEGQDLLCMTYVPKWRWLFAGREGGELKRFSADNHNQTPDTLGTSAGDVSALAAAPDGSLLAVGDVSGGLLLVDPSKLEVLDSLEGHEQAVTDLAFTTDGKLLFSSSLDGTVRIWNIKKREELAHLDAHGAPVHALAVDAKGKRLASGDEQGIVLMHGVKEGDLLETIDSEAGSVSALAFDPKGKVLAAPGPENTVRLWDVSKVK